MIKLISDIYFSGTNFNNLMQYISFRTAMGTITALLTCFVFGPKVILWLTHLKQGQVIRKDGPASHFQKAGTPTMGGLLIIIAVITSLLLWQDYSNIYMWLICGTLLLFTALGFLDDYLKISRKSSDGLKSRVKFIGQFIIATVATLCIYFLGGEDQTLLYIPFIKNPVLDLGLWYIPFGILLIIGFSNAVNLTDGLDGLATGLLITSFASMGIVTYLTGHASFAEYLYLPFIEYAGELTIANFTLLGACVGFLWYNCHPAEIFMGDTGSLSLGGILGVFALIIHKELMLLIIGGCFVIETASVMIQVLWFKKTGKRVFKMAPIHHHFELSGWVENKVVTRFWVIGLLFAIIGLASLKVQ